MSQSPLSSAHSSPRLPALPLPGFSLPSSLPSSLPRSACRLPPTTAYIFTHNLFSCTILDSTPPTVQIRCLQTNCNYMPKPVTLKVETTGNLIRHYKKHHLTIPTSTHSPIQLPSSDSSSFFLPRLCRPVPIPGLEPIDQVEYRRLLMDFIVANNLALSLVDSPEYQNLVEFLNP
jgi:hypothetical protein